MYCFLFQFLLVLPCFFLVPQSASGASCCYWLSNFFGRRLSRRLLSEKIDKFQAVVEQEAAQNNLFPYLLFARIFPMSPNFLLNLASPLVGVPFRWFFISVLFGTKQILFLYCRISFCSYSWCSVVLFQCPFWGVVIA